MERFELRYPLDIQLFADEKNEKTNGDDDKLDDSDEEGKNPNPAANSGKDGAGKDSSQTNTDDAKKAQSSKENALMKQKRLEREKTERERIEHESYVKGKIEGVKVNPYTDKPITNEKQLEVYELQVKLEKEGKDPLSDLPEAIAELEQKKADEQSKKEKESQEQDTRIATEKQAFLDSGLTEEDYQSLIADLKKPEYNGIFLKPMASGTMSILDAYNGIKTLKSKITSDVAAKEAAKKQVKTPSPDGGGAKPPKAVKDMTPEEIKAAYKKRFPDVY